MRALRQTLRRLANAPGFTLTTLDDARDRHRRDDRDLRVVNGVLIRPLPFPDSERLIALTHRQQAGLRNLPASPAIYFTYRDNNETFESVALWEPLTGASRAGASPRRCRRS